MSPEGPMCDSGRGLDLEKWRRKLLLAGPETTGAGSEKSRASPSGQILKAVQFKVFPNRNGLGYAKLYFAGACA